MNPKIRHVLKDIFGPLMVVVLSFSLASIVVTIFFLPFDLDDFARVFGMNMGSIISIIAFLKIYKVKFTLISIKTLLSWLFVITVIFFVLSGILNLFPDQKTVLDPDFNYYNGSSINLMMIVLSGVVTVPIVEEIFYRGVMLERMRQYLNPLLAVMISTTVFCLSHAHVIWESPPTIIGYAAYSLIFSFLYIKYESVTVPASLHMAANGLSTFFQMAHV